MYCGVEAILRLTIDGFPRDGMAAKWGTPTEIDDSILLEVMSPDSLNTALRGFDGFTPKVYFELFP